MYVKYYTQTFPRLTQQLVNYLKYLKSYHFVFKATASLGVTFSIKDNHCHHHSWGCYIKSHIYWNTKTHLGDIQGYLQMETHSTITCTPCY